MRGLSCLAFAFLLLVTGCFSQVEPQGKPADPPAESQPEPGEICSADGLAQAVFDNAVRVRTNDGSGSANVIDESADYYEFETNHHVGGSKGSRVVVDIWVGGDLVASRQSQVEQSWFDAQKSKDIAIFRVKKSDLGGPLPVIRLAPEGYESKLAAGDMVFTVGCQSGQSPRARCGNILEVKNGLIFYDPQSIPGDSGSAVYKYDVDDCCWYVIGRTAWYTPWGADGRNVGLAMTSDRVRSIRAGRVSDGWDLPTGAAPVPSATIGELPPMSIRLDAAANHELATFEQAVPLETSVRNWRLTDQTQPESGLLSRLLERHQTRVETLIRNESKPIREGIGAGIRWILLSVAGSVFFILVSGWLYLRNKLI